MMKRIFAIAIAAFCAAAEPGTGAAQAAGAAVNPPQTVSSALSRPQVELLRNVYRFATLRLEADRGPYVTAVANALNAKLVQLFRASFGDVPIGAGVGKLNTDMRQQGRILCSLLSDQTSSSNSVVFLLRCEMGNQRFNATHRRSIGIVGSGELIPAVEAVLREHIQALGRMYADAREGAVQ